jgi:hypothetical protein
MRHIIKKIAALSIGATMIGATLMGAMASDLSHSSQPVLDNGLGIDASDIANSIDTATALADTIHQEHGDIDFGKYDLSFEKNIESFSSVCDDAYSEDPRGSATPCPPGSNSMDKCCPQTKPQCCATATDYLGEKKDPVCCKSATGGDIGNEICAKNIKGNYCKATICTEPTPKMCPVTNANKADYPTCCPKDAECIDVGGVRATVWECGKKKCNTGEVQCTANRGNVFCCPAAIGCLNVGPYWMCGNKDCDKTKYTQCGGLSGYEVIQKCCANGIETCHHHPNGYPSCKSNPPEIEGGNGVQNLPPVHLGGTSMYLLRDSSHYQLSGIAYILSPKIDFNIYAELWFNNTPYNFPDPSLAKVYRYEQEEDVLDFCTEENVVDNKTLIISTAGSNISLNNEFFLNIPTGAVNNDTNLTIVKYSLSCPILDKEDNFIGAEGDVCLLENESGINSTDRPQECCANLTAIPNSTYINGELINAQPNAFICTNCGDDICGAGENKDNCAVDCNRSIIEKIFDWFSGKKTLREILRIIFFWKKG